MKDSPSRLLLATRRYEGGSDGGLSIPDASKNGRRETNGTLVVTLRAYVDGGLGHWTLRSEILTNIFLRYIRSLHLEYVTIM